MVQNKGLLLIALGGNALVEHGKKGTSQEHFNNIEKTALKLLPLLEMDYDIVLTHGNGPQVGNILIQNEESASRVPSMPLDVCVAESQGEIGYFIQQTFGNVLSLHRIRKEVVTIVTRVVVDLKDPAFERPSKPVGPFYDYEHTQSLIKNKKWRMLEDPSGKGFRRVVASPKPLHVVETRLIHQIILGGNIPIAVGGGGIPVFLNKKNRYEGVEAVIDKDLASSQLASDLKADKFIILTNVDNCFLNFRKKSQTVLKEMNLDEANTYLEQGQFSSGSMGPKVVAAIDYLTNGGKEAYITSIDKIVKALDKEAGTFIHH
jgi:carbamate kinase